MTQLDKYEIIEEIGRGSFAIVYRARDIKLNRVAALKVFRPHWLSDPGFVARFHHEAQAAANLHHSGIVTVYDIGEVDGQIYIAMEYVPGFTLQTMIVNEGAFTCANALPVLQQLAEAVDYAHSQGIIHRDIKPANILVDDSGAGIRVVLTDFGLAKVMEGSSALTDGGTLLGSLEYMSPEQADPNRAGDIGPASDLYALGIIAYQMLTGRVPFPGNSIATLNGHLTMEVPNPQRFAPKLPDAAVKALHKMLMKNPAARFATARSFVDALRIEASPEIAPKSTVNIRPLENPGPPISLESELSIHQDDGITDNNRDVISANNCERLELAQTLDGGPVIFSDRGRLLAFYGPPHVLNIWDIPQGTLRYTLPASNAAFSPAGGVLATDLDKTRVWRVDDGEPVYSVNGHNPKFSSKGLWLATEEKNNTSLWWASGGRFLHTLEGALLSFSPDETLAATRLPGPQVKLWDLQTRQLVQTFGIESEWEDLEFRNVVGGAFSPTGLFFVVVAVYGNVQNHYIGEGATEEIIRYGWCGIKSGTVKVPAGCKKMTQCQCHNHDVTGL